MNSAGKHKSKWFIFRIVLVIIEILLMLIFIAAPLNEGNMAAITGLIVMAVITISWGALRPFRESRIGKIVTIAGAILLAAGFAYAAVLSGLMLNAITSKSDNPNMIVVLGCQMWGENPSPMLQRRLDAAYEELIKHPEVPCIVTGGQGDDEVISEGEGMKRYLIRRGIDEDRIIKEDQSTSTFENIRNAFEITDKMGLSRDITIVTDGYHQYRASLIARSQGAGNITSICARTDLNLIPTYWVREWLGISHFFVLGS